MSFGSFLGFPGAVSARLAAAASRLQGEFGEIFDTETITALLEESAQRLSQANVSTFMPVLAERFARERLRALAYAEGRLAKPCREVLFVSLTGGGRAQIGAALLERRAGGEISVHSAGSQVTSGIDPNVLAVMREVGVDLSDAFSHPLTAEVLRAADVIVTMGRSVGELELPTASRHIDWRVGDPAGADIGEVRRVRDDIERRVETLSDELLAPTYAVSGPITGELLR